MSLCHGMPPRSHIQVSALYRCCKYVTMSRVSWQCVHHGVDGWHGAPAGTSFPGSPWELPTLRCEVSVTFRPWLWSQAQVYGVELVLTPDFGCLFHGPHFPFLSQPQAPLLMYSGYSLDILGKIFSKRELNLGFDSHKHYATGFSALRM